MVTIYRIDFADGTQYVGQTKNNLHARLLRHASASEYSNRRVTARLRQGMDYDVVVLASVDSAVAAARESKEILSLDSKVRLNLFDGAGGCGSGGNMIDCAPEMPADRVSVGKSRKFKPKKYNRFPPTVTHARCSKCRVKKPASEFSRDRTRFNGLHSRCRECYKLKVREACEAAIKARGGAETVSEKKCPKCKQVKPASEFNRNRFKISGLHHCCKVCKRKTDVRNRELKKGEN